MSSTSRALFKKENLALLFFMISASLKYALQNRKVELFKFIFAIVIALNTFLRNSALIVLFCARALLFRKVSALAS
jgi:hypothetical protein